MHILANFVIFDDFWTILIEKWTFWTTLLRSSNSLLSKSHDISAFSPTDPLRTCSKPCYFDLNLTILGPLWGSWRRLQLGPVHELPFGWRTCSEPSNPCLGPPILVILTTFPIEKSQFLSFCLSGVSENAILTLFWPHFEPSWAQTFGLPPKCAYFWPTALEGPWRDLTGPQFDPNFDHFGPLLRVLEEAG